VNKLGDAARVAGDDLIVSVRVTPRAKRNEIGDVVNGLLQIRTTAPPADGKANKAVIKLLAEFVDVPPSRVTLLRGATSRNKQFVVTAAANGL
jgi:uncharacterized protein (TIGR00251 family)